MSFYHLKYASFNKNENKITLTVADSALSPRTYFKKEYQCKDMSFEQNIEYFFVDLLNGNYHGGQKKVKDIVERMCIYRKIYAPDVSLDRDLELKVGRVNGLYHLLARMVAVPAITGVYERTEEHIAMIVRRYNRDTLTAYENAEKAYEDKGWIKTGACVRSDVFDGCDVWTVRNENKIIVGERACYENAARGFCNLKAGKNLILDAGPDGYLWCLFGYGTDADSSSLPLRFGGKDILADIPWDKLSEFKLNKLPYKDFPYEKYGFKIADAG